MTGPNDHDGPGPDDQSDADWGFPEVVDPASIDLPAGEPQAFDTGSDAWWRAQAQAQRMAAESEPPPPPPPPAPPVEPPPAPPLVTPEVLSTGPVPGGPGPLDRDWPGPAATPAVTPPAVTPPAVTPPAATPPAAPAPPPPAEPVPPAPPAEAQRPSAFRRAEPPAVPPPPPPAPPSVSRPAPPPAAAAVPAAAAAAGLPAEQAPSEAPTRPPYEGDRIGVGRAVAGAGLAVVGVLLGVGALLLFHDDGNKGTPTVQAPPATAPVTAAPTQAPTAATTPRSTPSPTSVATAAPAPSAAPPAQPAVLPVSVLNNSRIKGLAATAAARFRAGGWPVPVTGNYSGGTLATTTVYYAPGEQASAERFARQFGIARVAPRFPGLPTRGMTVVLTRDYR